MFGFEIRAVLSPSRREKERVEALLALHGLIYEGTPDCTILIEDSDENLVATAGIQDNVVKMVAVDPEWQDAGLAGIVISKVLQYAGENGIFHLFVYTKPDMADKFASMGFHELARVDSAVLLESGQPSAEDYCAMLKSQRFTAASGPFGAVVVNCNPFTLGHRYLIETAAERCGGLYVIVVQEDVSVFPFKDRMRLVREGVKDILNVRVLPSGDYAVSRATFPTYFLKDRGVDAVSGIQAELDVTLFANLFVPALSLSIRFVGTEPFCATTEIYNKAMKKILPAYGVEVVEILRANDPSGTAISASRVRKAIKDGDCDILKMLLPEVTLDYLASEEGRHVAERLRAVEQD